MTHCRVSSIEQSPRLQVRYAELVFCRSSHSCNMYSRMQLRSNQCVAFLEHAHFQLKRCTPRRQDAQSHHHYRTYS
jgi:hypothetical protein